MCGIAGIVDYNRPSGFYAKTLEQMRDALHHRGPDEQNILLLPHVGLSHTRLSIIDPQGSHQPLASPDGRWVLTYNGEVYNYLELRREIKDRWNFKTQGDTEVVMAAWALWGSKSLHRLNGMFAFFIWDSLEKRGFLVRDRLGIKPAVWSYNSGIFSFASEAKALISVKSDDTRINEHAVLEYLAAPFFSGVFSPMFAGIENLQPGTFLEISQGGVKSRTWSDYRLDIDDGYAPDLYEPLRDSIRRTLVSDMPICTFLSGGFDSTLITKQVKELGSTPLDAYTIVFPEQGQFEYDDAVMTNANDTPYAIDFAKNAGIQHHLVMTETKTLADRIKSIAISNDALPAWEQELAQNALSQAAGRQYKVVLVGDAADETHYGYHFLLDPHTTATPANVINRFVHDGFINKARMADPIGHFDDLYKNLCASQGYAWGKNAEDNILATTYLIVKRWLPRLLHNGDIHTMNHSLEARVPFGDTDLLDIARRISPHKAYSAGQEKHWLRQCSQGLLPDNIRLRKKSALPKDQNVSLIYKNELRQALQSSGDFLRHFVDMDKVSALCAIEKHNNEKEHALMFRLICIAHWRNHYNVAI